MILQYYLYEDVILSHMESGDESFRIAAKVHWPNIRMLRFKSHAS